MAPNWISNTIFILGLGEMTKSYEEKIEFERNFFDAELYDEEKLIEKVPDALGYVLDHFDTQVSAQLGKRPWDYIVDRINSFKHAEILSIGTGPCGLEIHIAKQIACPYQFECLEINEKMLELGVSKAAMERLIFRPVVQDANKLALSKEYDVVLAHASLHHLVNLEHVFTEIGSHLSPEGYFFVYESTPRNGMLLWPETKDLIARIWKVMPERWRVDCTRSGTRIVCDEYPERDVSINGFECVRSQDIIPLLSRYFKPEHRFSGLSFVRRFVDREFGPDYDLARVEDKLFIDLLLALDDHLVSEGSLNPEIIFYVLRKLKE